MLRPFSPSPAISCWHTVGMNIQSCCQPDPLKKRSAIHIIICCLAGADSWLEALGLAFPTERISQTSDLQIVHIQISACLQDSGLLMMLPFLSHTCQSSQDSPGACSVLMPAYHSELLSCDEILGISQPHLGNSSILTLLTALQCVMVRQRTLHVSEMWRS